MRHYFFVRHAVPVNDAGSFHLSALDRDMMGHKDEALSAIGQEQARRLAAVLGSLQIDRVVSSQMARARETASILAGCKIPFTEKWCELNELNPGGLSPRRLAQLRRVREGLLPAALRRRLDPSWQKLLTVYYLAEWRRGATRGGDRREEMAARIRTILTRLDALPERRVAVVGHGFWILFMATSVIEGLRWRELGWVGNCSVTRVDCPSPGQYRLGYFARKLA